MKWYTYIICFILIIVGTFCGIQLYKEVKAESYVNGSIDISNKFSQESFDYSSTSVVFYHDLYDDTDTYTFEQDLLKVDDYNGKTKTYQVWLNDFILLDTEFNAGSVYSTVKMDFYDEYGSIVCNSNMQISIKFLSNKTQLTLSTSGQENASFLEQYFSDNGIRLKVIEIL
jgi:hypothetical protein